MQLEGISVLFSFIGGLGMFLYGMHVMANGLQHFAGGKMQRLMSFLTQNRLMAILVGTLVTAVIQSSSATTVMVVGFVNAGMLNLSQAVGVIMGANIGTTITAWLVSLSEFGSFLNPEFYAPLLLGIGAFVILFTKSEKKKQIGEILIGFAILFIGLSFMSDAIKPYRDSPVFSNAFTVLGKNPVLAILTGTVVTAIIQSSSASVGILQTLAMNGIVNWRSAVFITLGQNIGTCVTALLSGVGSDRNGKRAAVIHLLFNVIGAVLFGVAMYVLFLIFPAWGASFHFPHSIQHYLYGCDASICRKAGMDFRKACAWQRPDSRRTRRQRSKKDGETLRQQSTWKSALCAGNGSAGGFCDGACDLPEPGACACGRVRRKSAEGAEGIRAGKRYQQYGKNPDGVFGRGR